MDRKQFVLTLRESFVRNAITKEEREFWKRFFEEIDIDKRKVFVRANFKKGPDFGVHVYNTKLFCCKKYSLMYTRDRSFEMNKKTYRGKKFRNGLDRMKHWCKTPGLPEKFYCELENRNLLEDMESICISSLVADKPSEIEKTLSDLFFCIDLFG